MVLILIGVAVVSTTGWLLSLRWPRSAVRRHFVLMTTLAGCLLLPIAVGVQQGTDWTLLAIRGSASQRPVEAAELLSEPEERTVGASGSLRPAKGDETVASIASIASIEAMNQEISEPDPQVPAARRTRVAEDDVASPTAKQATRASVPGSEAVAEDRWAFWAGWFTVVYLIVAGWMLLRLATGLASVRRLRRRAVEVDALAGGVRVLEADVAVPVAVGLGTPAILLPRGFRQAVAAEELRDVLTHEQEHLRRGDNWIILLQGVTAAAYWPIVSVHLLNRALARAREELCDNAVLAKRDPAAYGQTLLAVAEEVSGRHASPANRLAPSIIRRGELEQRVSGLLDDHRDRRTRAGWWGRWASAALLLTTATLAGTTRVVAVAVERPASPTTPGQSQDKEITGPKENHQWTDLPTVDLKNAVLHRGVVLGPEGMPLAGASVYAASTIELLELAAADEVDVNDLGPVRAVTDAEGRFEFTASDLSWVTPAGTRKRWESLLVATKEGLAPGWLKTWGADRSFRSHSHPSQKRKVALQMRPTETLTGQFLLEDDKPLSGARVRLTGLMAPVGYDLGWHVPQEEENALGMFQSIDYAETLYRPWLLPGLTTEATTNEDGRFELTGLQEGFIARLEVTHPAAVTTSLRAAIRPMEPVYRKPGRFGGQGKPTLTLYGSGFTAKLAKGMVLRGRVTGMSWQSKDAAVGVTVALANHNAKDGMSGQRFTTDASGQFEVTGLPNRSRGYELAFSGSFAAPFGSRRQRIVPGENARVELVLAVPYRLKLSDPDGKPVDREVYSNIVQIIPGTDRRDVKWQFNDAVRVAPGVYEGIVPTGPGAVLVKRGSRKDRPVAVDPKAFFAPGRTDWTLEEERYAYGDAWRIARPAVIKTERLSVARNQTIDQLELAAVVFTNAKTKDGVLELTATVASDPPVKLTLVDEAGKPVEGARLERQLKRYNGRELPATLLLYGLHPQRAEFLTFTHEERGLIGTLSTTWTDRSVRVVMRPAATLIGRFADDSGQTNFDFGARVRGQGVPPDTFVAGRVHKPTEIQGERKGEFRLMVPPGVEVRGEFVRKTFDRLTRPSVGTAFGPLIPKPAEIVDLGSLTVP